MEISVCVNEGRRRGSDGPDWCNAGYVSTLLDMDFTALFCLVRKPKQWLALQSGLCLLGARLRSLVPPV